MSSPSNRAVLIDIRCRDCGEVYTAELSVLRDAHEFTCTCGAAIPLGGGCLVDWLRRSDSHLGRTHKRG